MFEFTKIVFAKNNSLLSCFCKTDIPIKFAIIEKYYTYITITKRYIVVLRKKSEAQKREKETKKAECKSLKLLASGCPKCHDVHGV